MQHYSLYFFFIFVAKHFIKNQEGNASLVAIALNVYFKNMWYYYRDVTLYAIAVCLLFGLASAPARESIASGILVTVIIFGLFGTGLGILAFWYFQKQQYYMYYNLGFTKRYLILYSWSVNAVISGILSFLILPFL